MRMKVNADLKAENQGKVKFFYLSDEIEGATKAEIIETAKEILYLKARKILNTYQSGELNINYVYEV